MCAVFWMKLRDFSRSSLPSLAICCLCLAVESCTAIRRPPSPHAERAKRPGVLYEWWGDEAGGKLSMRINLATQKAKIFRGGKQVGWTTVATGRSEYPTHPGHFHIIEKEAKRISCTYGMIVGANGEVIDRDARNGREPIPAGAHFAGSPMPYWMQITSYGVGMHAGYIPRPGHPASHGCIRLPREMAERLFEIAPIGTPVTIVDSNDD
jgi:lipoprotein-anchoring transpeptidase ErfK/SrfK